METKTFSFRHKFNYNHTQERETEQLVVAAWQRSRETDGFFFERFQMFWDIYYMYLRLPCICLWHFMQLKGQTM